MILQSQDHVRLFIRVFEQSIIISRKPWLRFQIADQRATCDCLTCWSNGGRKGRPQCTKKFGVHVPRPGWIWGLFGWKSSALFFSSWFASGSHWPVPALDSVSQLVNGPGSFPRWAPWPRHGKPRHGDDSPIASLVHFWASPESDSPESLPSEPLSESLKPTFGTFGCRVEFFRVSN